MSCWQITHDISWKVTYLASFGSCSGKAWFWWSCRLQGKIHWAWRVSTVGSGWWRRQHRWMYKIPLCQTLSKAVDVSEKYDVYIFLFIQSLSQFMMQVASFKSLGLAPSGLHVVALVLKIGIYILPDCNNVACDVCCTCCVRHLLHVPHLTCAFYPFII